MIYNVYVCIILALGAFFGMLFYIGHMLINQPWYQQYRDYALTAAVAMVAIIIAGLTAVGTLLVLDGLGITSRCFRLVTG
jgi:hypothetical protein